MADHPSDLNGFIESGYAVIRDVVPAELRSGIQDAVAALQDGAKGMSQQVLYTHATVPNGSPPLTNLIDQWLNPFRLRGDGSTVDAVNQLRGIAEEFFGEEMQIFQDLIFRRTQAHGHFPWHQDASYWPVQFRRGATFWTPLRKVNGSDGGLYVDHGYRIGRAAAVDLHTGEKQDGSGQLEPSRPVAPELSPGDILIIGPTTLHRSGNEIGPVERIVHASIWLDMDARWDHEVAPNHPMCALTKHGELLRLR